MFKQYQKQLALTFVALIIAFGVFMRLRGITLNEFLFYDEGMYIGYNRDFLNLVAQNPPHDLQEFFIILNLMLKKALSTAKALWFFILNLRVFIMGPEAWYFARVISAAAGLGSVVLTYFFAKRYFNSMPVALTSALILLILPSHVFYSRLGMQESLSALLFLGSMYLYIFSPKGFSIKLFISAFLLGCVYLTNYRMIIGPIFLITAQVFFDYFHRQKVDILKIFYCCIIFAVVVFGIGGLYGGINAKVNLGWMLNQAQESHAHRHVINFLSFPYYFFKLENIFFALFLAFNIYLIIRRKFDGALPFILVFMQMVLFSFAAEKGARYLCVVLPFAAMAVAHAVNQLKQEFPVRRAAVNGAAVLMIAGLLWNSYLLSKGSTDYGKAVAMVLAQDPQAKIISTQPLVESLYIDDVKRIVPCPKDPGEFLQLLSQGYRYLILDPQVYISWTADGERFTPSLMPHLELVRQRLAPLAVLSHIEGGFLERFVLDHNQDLNNSLEFLESAKGRGSIYIYDLRP